MAMLCIGGVCIPYSALLPFLILGLKYVLQKLVSYGILPQSIEQSIIAVLPNTKRSNKNKNKKKGDELCCNGTSTTATTKRDKRQKTDKNETKNNDETQQPAAPQTSTTVLTIDSEEEWENLMSQDSTTVIAKFTASWCKPCKAIQPFYVGLAEELLLLQQKQQQKSSTSNNNNNKTSYVFVTIDSDEYDEIAGQFGITMLPTFCIMQNNTLLDKYNGSDQTKLSDFIKKNVNI